MYASSVAFALRDLSSAERAMLASLPSRGYQLLEHASALLEVAKLVERGTGRREQEHVSRARKGQSRIERIFHASSTAQGEPRRSRCSRIFESRNEPLPRFTEAHRSARMLVRCFHERIQIGSLVLATKQHHLRRP